MRLVQTNRHPNWIVASVYVGRKKKFQGLAFPTLHTYFNKKVAQSCADRLNAKARVAIFKGPGVDFEFQVLPYGEA